MNEKLALLKELYSAASWLEKNVFSCEKGCSTCCTQSVTMSSLEGELIFRFMKQSPDLTKFIDFLYQENKPYRPTMTTNHFARVCLEKTEIAAQANDWSFTPCVFLENSVCQIYDVRPFSCRAFVSLTDCQKDGTASAPPVIITLNTIMHQIIEHFSAVGCWGNMLDILCHIFEQKEVFSRKNLPTDVVLHEAEVLPGFLVEKNERPVIQKYLDEISTVLQQFEQGQVQNEVRAVQHYLYLE